MAGSFLLKKDESLEGVFLLEDIPHYVEQAPVARGSRQMDLADLSPAARFAVEVERSRDESDQFQHGIGRQEDHLGDYRCRDGSARDRSASPVVPPFRGSENSLFIPETSPSDLPTSTTAPRSSRGPSGPRNNSRGSISAPQAHTDPQDGECTCTISYACPRRANNKLDCRPLVDKFMRWNESMDQEAYKR